MVIFQLTKNSKLFFTTLILMIFYSIEGNAVEVIKFKIDSEDEKLRFTLVNNSYEEIIVNRIFSIAPTGKRGNIELYFIDENDKRHNLSAKINFKKTSKNDFIYHLIHFMEKHFQLIILKATTI